ncbi:TM2 domain-containing protein [Bacteroides sp. 224]|uniref:TM2 domain-containing protein n=1 Tax=Bacteroides sp. 224 TaxID=2302936 RepID=UPI0013D49586|nr:TM2 domain-containing protein [Bacteroides sp. 224]NDV65459.1 TM2 domain-containing protein [Bacteroides sp. 224]
MEKSKIDTFIKLNVKNFNHQDMKVIREELEKLDDSKWYLIEGIEFQKPFGVFLIAIFLGLERFLLEDYALAVLKVITLNGFFVWWFLDIFSAEERARTYNFNKFMHFILYA